MIKTLLLATLLGVGLLSSAQQVRPKRCATYESQQEFIRNNPRAQTDAQFEAWMSQKMAARNASGQRNLGFYTIPIIFHIIHTGGAVGTGQNLSQAQVQQQLNQLNADFANLSGSKYPVAANVEVQFCLATVDPNGQTLAEPGIERITYSAKGWAAPPYDGFPSTSYVDQTIMPGSIWNANSYYNVWTMELSGSLLGKATFPEGSGLSGIAVGSGETDTHAGVFIDYRSVGSLCQAGAFGSSAGLGRTLTHETGHFLGLRHIWGDAACGNDYCDDTPVQSQESIGCPTTGTLNGCTPSVPRMFENYMDYTDDACVNTFTQNQRDRMQIVMTSSPRRSTLPNAATCAGAPANSIRFNYTCAGTKLETAEVVACPGYRDISVQILVQAAASGAATLSFTKSGTATDNVDYVILPASITYAAGETVPKTVTIRVWDDAVAESTETITIGYAITGSGVVAGSNNQSFTVSIIDDDINPGTISNNGTVPYFTENFSSGGTGWFSGSFINPAGVNVWTVSASGGAGVAGNAAHITNNTSTKDYQYTIAGTSSTSNAVFRSPQINGSGKASSVLSFKYKVEGEVAGSTYYDYGTVMYSLDGSSFSTLTDASGNLIRLQGAPTLTTATIQLPSVLNNTSYYIGFRWINDNSDGIQPPLLVDDISIVSAATGTEGDAGQTATENIFANQDVYLKSTVDNQVIARISAPSSTIGCLTATVAQAGDGQVTVTTNAGTFQRTQKVITLVPVNPNPTVTYQATLYFSSAELAVWGANKTALKILQVADDTNLSGTLTGANSKLITPTTVVEDAANGVITYTATFTSFSQFMLVSPNLTLPVNLITFEAQPTKRSIELSWKTAQERNNKGFVIERSINGTDFTTIGWVSGVSTTNEPSLYNYTDNFVQPNTVYYYRLRQTDFDGRAVLSSVRNAKINESGLVVTVSPNPVKGQMSVFVSGSTQPAGLQLVNAKGQIVARWVKANLSAPYTVDVSKYARGYYTLVISLPDTELTKTIILE